MKTRSYTFNTHLVMPPCGAATEWNVIAFLTQTASEVKSNHFCEDAVLSDLKMRFKQAMIEGSITRKCNDCLCDVTEAPWAPGYVINETFPLKSGFEEGWMKTTVLFRFP